MIFPILLVSLLSALLWVTVRGKDAWPFSHYPMFSGLADIAELEVFRLALETTEGDLIWWRSEFYRYPEVVGRTLKHLQRLEGEGGQSRALAGLERQRLLAAVLRLIEVEEGRSDRYRAFQVVRRTVAADDDGALKISEQTVITIPLAEIKRIRRAD